MSVTISKPQIHDWHVAVVDYDGNAYDTVTIGTQTWTVQNLRVTHYRDGTLIPNLIDSGAWISDTNGAYCWYNNDIGYADPYGALYNWYAVDNALNLAPLGWRVPTATDFSTLITYCGGAAVAGGYLKEVGLTHWTTPNTSATDTYGFKAVAGGLRTELGNFSQMGQYSYLRGSTYNFGTANELELEYDDDEAIHELAYLLIPGLAVRLIKE